MKKGSKLYIRIDYRIEETDMTDQDYRVHLDYAEALARERFFIGGGFSNVDGGMLLFKAESMEEAQQIAQNDPIIQRGIYRCDVFEWDLFVLSENLSGK